MGSERVSYAPLAEVRDRMMQAESASRDEKDLEYLSVFLEKHVSIDFVCQTFLH